MSDDLNHAATFSERPRKRGRRPVGSRNLTFATNLKALRQRERLTQEQLNDALDLPMGTISRWEQRTHEPTLDQLVTLGAYFHVPPGQLLDPAPVYGFGATEAKNEIWQRFILDLLAHYPTSRIEINFWADNQTAYIHPPESSGTESV
jgi:transcriptional regulator with XRE-family HTH domain